MRFEVTDKFWKGESDMNKPLFSNVPRQDADTVRLAKIEMVCAWILFFLVVVFWLEFLLYMQFDPMLSILSSFGPLTVIAIAAMGYVDALGVKRKHLFIYENKIVFKKGAFQKERELMLAPRDYKIKVIKKIHRDGPTIHLIFLDQTNRCLFRYTTYYSLMLSRRLKYGLRQIGCEIMDPPNGY